MSCKQVLREGGIEKSPREKHCLHHAIIVLYFIFAFLSMSSMVFESLHFGCGYFFFLI